MAFSELVGSRCSRFGDIGESSQGALGPHRFGFRTHLLGSCRAGILRRLTIRSSRPHVVASAACFALRLHASAAPPRVGLTQALGRVFIYIDESGNFVPSSSTNSWSVVAAYVIPEATRRRAEDFLRQLKLSIGRAYSEEIKLRDLSDAQIKMLIANLGRLDSILFVSCIDLGSQDPAVIANHKNNQIEKIRKNKPKMIYEEGRQMIEDLAVRVERLSPQLYTQMVAQVDLLHQVHRSSTLYYAQRVPSTLSSFRWRIDEKNSSRPAFEETMRYMALPMLQNRSLSEPGIFVNEFDYSHYERAFRFAPGEMPTYLQKETGIEVQSGVNLGKILRDFTFERSHDVPGIQIADLLASSVRRVLRNGFKDNLDMARQLGRLTVQHAKPQKPIHLISLSKDQSAYGHVVDVVQTMEAATRPMLQ